ncbi:hypothetical protein [Bradyrhizobium sp.]|nr:hypothetical protein [Bradyrhizobium sp.]
MRKTILTLGTALIALSAVQPEWPGYGYGDGYYSRGFSAPAGR